MRIAPLVVAVLFACGDPVPQVSPRIAAVLDSLVPGVQVGGRAHPVARKLGLEFAPYVGYGDSAFENHSDVSSLAIVVNQTLYSETDRPSRWARIAYVGLGFRRRQATESARQLLVRRLGAPEPYCYTRGDEVEFQLYFWPDEGSRGVLLSIPTDSTHESRMTFETQRPGAERSLPGLCDAA